MTKFNEAQQAFLEKLIRFVSDDPYHGFDVEGDWGDVIGDVRGNVEGDVYGTVRKGQNDD